MILVSSDLAEVIGVSDRIIVMKEGRIAGEVAKAQATPDALISSRCRASAPQRSTGCKRHEPGNATPTHFPVPDAAVVPARARGGVWQLINRSGIVMVFLVLFATLSLTVPDFLTPRNIQGLLLSVTLIGSIAVTMMFVLALGEVDLSVASIVAFSGVVASTLITATHSVVLGVAGGVLAGGAVGSRQRRADRALADQLADRHARDDGSRARPRSSRRTATR